MIRLEGLQGGFVLFKHTINKVIKNKCWLFSGCRYWCKIMWYWRGNTRSDGVLWSRTWWKNISRYPLNRKLKWVQRIKLRQLDIMPNNSFCHYKNGMEITRCPFMLEYQRLEGLGVTMLWHVCCRFFACNMKHYFILLAYYKLTKDDLV